MQCDFFSRNICRSCRWLDRDYADQLSAKDAALHALLDAHRPQEWLMPVASPQAGFRNKAKMAVLGARNAPVLGIVNSNGEEVGLCDCPLYPADMRDLLRRVQDWIREAGLPPYSIDRRQGELKYILLTRSQHTGEYMLRLVLRSEESLARIRQCLAALLAGCAKISVVSVNIQPVHMAILEGDKEIFLTGNTRLVEKLNDVPLYIRPKSFFQTNPAVAAELYKAARNWTAEIEPATLLDLYCGVGGFGLHCATPDTAVTGVEIEPEAIACAQLSAKEIGLPHAVFVALDSSVYALKKTEPPDLVIINPPRRGIGQALCAQLVDAAPRYILYSSCNAETLSQDLTRLPGYQLARVQFFDMFPHTPHYEVLVMLARRESPAGIAANRERQRSAYDAGNPT
jgi:23S rRNA (uracil747-C5)-methyltransferase